MWHRFDKSTFNSVDPRRDALASAYALPFLCAFYHPLTQQTSVILQKGRGVRRPGQFMWSNSFECSNSFSSAETRPMGQLTPRTADLQVDNILYRLTEVPAGLRYKSANLLKNQGKLGEGYWLHSIVDTEQIEGALLEVGGSGDEVERH